MTKTNSMKRIALVLALAVSVTFSLANVLMLQNANANENTKTVYVVESIKQVEKVKTGKKTEKYVYNFSVKYNPDGLAASTSEKSSDGKTIYTYEYNNGMIVGKKEIIKDPTGDIVNSYKYIYKNNRLTGVKGEVGYVAKVKTDSKGRIVRDDACNAIYKYNKKDQIVKVKNISNKSWMKWDNKTIKYDKKGTSTGKGIKNYYSKGKKRPYKRVEKTKYTVKENGKKVKVSVKDTYSFKYKAIKVSANDYDLVKEQQRIRMMGIQTRLSLFFALS